MRSRLRNGSQRHRCDVCARTFTEATTLATDRRKLAADKAVLVLRMILEGNSVRSTERLCEVHRDTILSLLVKTGELCESFLSRVVRGVTVNDVEADEIWSFVACKERTRERKCYGDEKGDAWCFVAIERDTKLVLTFHVDKRTPAATLTFSEKLRDATSGRFQLSTDGFRPYRIAIPAVFGDGIDFAQLVKTRTAMKLERLPATRRGRWLSRVAYGGDNGQPQR